jgi:transcription elongation factor Elf1
MPTYQWDCPGCGESRDVIAAVKDRQRQQVCECGRLMTRTIVPSQVMPDIAPYMAVSGDRMGQMIRTRQEHKAFLRRNKFIEVGNEPIRPIKNDFRPRKGEIARELKSVIPQILKR